MTAGSLRRMSALLVVVGLLCMSRPARSHELDSASLSLTEVAAGRFLVRWHVNSAALREELKAPAVFPKPCRFDGTHLECGSSGLVGSIEFPWLAGTQTSTIVDIEWQNGTRLVRVVRPNSPSLRVYGIPASAGVGALAPLAVDYVRLGIEHIALGFDHLAFVVALTLLIAGARRLLLTITAFTLAHSITLAGAGLDVVELPLPPVEAAIALSIVLVCRECLRPVDSLTRRAPWIVAFAFGLLHGFGFASALLAVGLPERYVPTALVCFNLGVELGQIGVVALVLLLRHAAHRLGSARTPWLARSVVYALGGCAGFWSIERIREVFGG